jgi:hypothetical protein
MSTLTAQERRDLRLTLIYAASVILLMLVAKVVGLC